MLNDNLKKRIDCKIRKFSCDNTCRVNKVLTAILQPKIEKYNIYWLSYNL